jgi:hypothetical protein
MRFVKPIQLIVIVVFACTQRGETTVPLSHPAGFVGRWVRQISDTTWGDTLDLHLDGTVTGSVTNPVPAGAKWGVRETALGQELCLSDPRERSCKSFKLSDQFLVTDEGPNGKTTLRRVP